MAIRKRPTPHRNTAKLEEDLDKYLASNPDDEPEYFSPPPKSTSRKHAGRNILKALIALIALAMASGGGYWFATQHRVASPPPTTNTQTRKPQSATVNSTAHYVVESEELNLSFDYPADWSVAPSTKTNTNKPITVTSPATTIAAADGVDVRGKAIITIRPGSATVSELDANNPSVVQTSYQVAYTAPSAMQNKYPYLTFIHYDNGVKAADAFEQVIVTGVRPFNKGEVINSTALVGLDPITSVAFIKCTTKACTGSGAARLGITDTTWQQAPIFKQTLKVIESLKIN